MSYFTKKRSVTLLGRRSPKPLLSSINVPGQDRVSVCPASGRRGEKKFTIHYTWDRWHWPYSLAIFHYRLPFIYLSNNNNHVKSERRRVTQKVPFCHRRLHNYRLSISRQDSLHKSTRISPAEASRLSRAISSSRSSSHSKMHAPFRSDPVVNISASNENDFVPRESPHLWTCIVYKKMTSINRREYVPTTFVVYPNLHIQNRRFISDRDCRKHLRVKRE